MRFSSNFLLLHCSNPQDQVRLAQNWEWVAGISGENLMIPHLLILPGKVNRPNSENLLWLITVAQIKMVMVVYALRTVFHNNIFNNYEAVIIPIISTTWKVKAGKFQVSGGLQQSHATSSQIYIYRLCWTFYSRPCFILFGAWELNPGPVLHAKYTSVWAAFLGVGFANTYFAWVNHVIGFTHDHSHLMKKLKYKS